jgi:hypothetical protein
MKTNPTVWTIREFHPVDGDFQLILKDGVLFAKTYNTHTAKSIIEAMKAKKTETGA